MVRALSVLRFELQQYLAQDGPYVVAELLSSHV